jgi:AraC-like DNA-binding protein
MAWPRMHMISNESLDHQQASTIGSVVILIDKALRTYGIDPGPLFLTAGIDFREATRPDARLPTVRLSELHRRIVDVTGDRCFGLKMAAQMQPANLHGLGFSWLASDSLLDALERLVRFSKLINNVARLRLETSERTIELVLYDLDKLPAATDSAIDSALAVFLRMCRIAAGNSINPLRVDLSHSRPPCHHEFARVFCAPVAFNATDNRLCFDRASLEASLPSAHPELARINDQTVIDYLARFDRDNTSMRVRTRLIEQLPSGTPRQGSIARELNIGLRSMQRKLKDEGTSFNDLLDSTRRELAMHYVRESHRSLGEVAYLLGFAEPGSFTRAFRRWAGVTPQAFREQRAVERQHQPTPIYPPASGDLLPRRKR